jgi:hypothetical protein
VLLGRITVQYADLVFNVVFIQSFNSLFDIMAGSLAVCSLDAIRSFWNTEGKVEWHLSSSGSGIIRI